MSPRSKREHWTPSSSHTAKQLVRQKQRSWISSNQTAGIDRKQAVRLLNTFQRFLKPKKRQRGREQRYRPEELPLPLKRIWKTDYMLCSKRLNAIIVFSIGRTMPAWGMSVYGLIHTQAMWPMSLPWRGIQ